VQKRKFEKCEEQLISSCAANDVLRKRDEGLFYRHIHPLIIHQSPIIHHQSSFNHHHSSIIIYQSSIIHHPSSPAIIHQCSSIIIYPSSFIQCVCVWGGGGGGGGGGGAKRARRGCYVMAFDIGKPSVGVVELPVALVSLLFYLNAAFSLPLCLALYFVLHLRSLHSC